MGYLAWATTLAAASAAALIAIFIVMAYNARRYQSRLSFRYIVTRPSAFGAFLAILFGVSIILVVVSIMGGYIETFREKIRGQESHLIAWVRRPYGMTNRTAVEDAARRIDNVSATAVFIETLAVYRSGGFKPCQLRGVEIEQQVAVTDMGRYTLRPAELDAVMAELQAGTAAADEDSDAAVRTARTRAKRAVDRLLDAPERAPLTSEEFAGFFSRDFRRRLLTEKSPQVAREYARRAPPQAVLVGLQLLVDAEVFVGQIVPVVTIDPDTSKHVSIPLLVAGAFKTGTFETDSGILYMDVQALRNRLDLFDSELNSSRYEGLRIAVRDESRVHETKAALRQSLRELDPDFEVVAWDELNLNRIRAVEREKYVIYFLLVLIVAFTACMILLMLILTVIEKRRDIGILLALGATPGGIVGIFLINGLALTVAGTAAGLLSGYVFCSNINPIHDWLYTVTGIQLFPPDVYDLDRIPISFRTTEVLLSVTPALLLGFLASLIPAVWASRRDPIETIHHE